MRIRIRSGPQYFFYTFVLIALAMNKEAFINYLRYEKRMSPHTVLAYSNDLDQFYIYLKTVYSLEDIKEVNHAKKTPNNPDNKIL